MNKLKQWYSHQIRHEWALGFVRDGMNGIFSSKPTYIWVTNPYRKTTWFADPFILDVTDHKIVLLVEEFRYAEPKGRIARLIIDRNSWTITDVKILLELSTHLSFPSIWRKDGKVYVYPENSEANQLNLYEYDDANQCLKRVNTWCKEPLTDAIMTEFFGHEQIYSTRMPCPNSAILNCYERNADGKFVLIRDYKFPDKHARMAGQFFEYDGIIYRPGQDCNINYGGGVVIDRVIQQGDVLKFQPIKILRSTHSTLRSGMHTLNTYKDIVVVDVHGYPYCVGKIIKRLVRLKKMMKL